MVVIVDSHGTNPAPALVEVIRKIMRPDVKEMRRTRKAHLNTEGMTPKGEDGELGKPAERWGK